MADLVTAIDARLSDLENQHNTLALETQRQIDELIERIEDLEAKVPKVDEPVPKRDTGWRPYDWAIDTPPGGDERVVVMIRSNDEITYPAPASHWNWDEHGKGTIVAWRYAKEGE